MNSVQMKGGVASSAQASSYRTACKELQELGGMLCVFFLLHVQCNAQTLVTHSNLSHLQSLITTECLTRGTAEWQSMHEYVLHPRASIFNTKK